MTLDFVSYVARRVLLMTPVLVAITALVFMFLSSTGVDPVVVVLGTEYTPEQAAVVRRQLGLDKPVPLQYVLWLQRALQGDLGRSFIHRAEVSVLILERLPRTALLAFAAMAISVAVSVPAGVVSATKRNSWFDATARVISMLGVSVPVFWLGILLIVFFALWLRWLPPGGSLDLYGPQALVLPAVTLGASLAGLSTRLTRSSMLEVITMDYVRTARAKGLAEIRVLYTHALRNALLPVITMLGLQFGSILSGAVLTETVFAMPGLGRLLVDSIHNRDYPVVQGCVLLITVFFVVINLFVDLLYALIDPRIRYT